MWLRHISGSTLTASATHPSSPREAGCEKGGEGQELVEASEQLAAGLRLICAPRSLAVCWGAPACLPNFCAGIKGIKEGGLASHGPLE
eukprot:scaffold311918_cov24-Tisochrysis_lutea.AAC.2